MEVRERARSKGLDFQSSHGDGQHRSHEETMRDGV